MNEGQNLEKNKIIAKLDTTIVKNHYICGYICSNTKKYKYINYMNKNSIKIYKLTISAILLTIGLLLPLLTGQIPEIGNMLCPMHIPVFIVGLALGPIYGGIIGFIFVFFSILLNRLSLNIKKPPT